MTDLRSFIRNVPDFPKKGIVFRDITTLLNDKKAFRIAVDEMCRPYQKGCLDAVVGIESRGFIFGGSMAIKLGTRFIPARKPGKLPAQTLQETYALEYGTDAVEIHRDAIKKGERILIVDDLLATGGTAAATIRLVRKLGGDVIGASFLIELCFLNGRTQLEQVPIHVIVGYEQE